MSSRIMSVVACCRVNVEMMEEHVQQNRECCSVLQSYTDGHENFQQTRKYSLSILSTSDFLFLAKKSVEEGNRVCSENKLTS